MRRLSACLAALLGLIAPSTASADVLLTPFAGVSFFDEGNKKPVYGVGLAFGGLIGIEAEIAQARLGEYSVPSTPVDLEASLTTAMVNLMVRVPAGPVQPYVTGGVGVLRLKGDVTVPFLGSVFSASGQDFGMNVGGGLYLFPSDNIGIRGDLRYFRSIGDFTLDEITDIDGLDDLPVPDLDFWRATGGLTIRF